MKKIRLVASMPYVPFSVVLAFLLLVLFFLIKIQIITYAFEKIGIQHQSLFFLLFLSLLGSYVNIPLWQIPPLIPSWLVRYSRFGTWSAPLPLTIQTTIAVNLGGAIIPSFISLRLMTKTPSPGKATLATLIVALIIQAIARPVPGVGIVVPALFPPLCAALISLLIEGQATPQTAYIAGSIGTLIGADLVNLPKLACLGLPVASIGGAGTFDGIFLTGLIAALLA
ncbi:MAG: DUF1614 domain-containing protein [bacterium]|nr:DUF1614 domain-containing protein [bacterium]